jgi:serine/threonine-protein kinase
VGAVEKPESGATRPRWNLGDTLPSEVKCPECGVVAVGGARACAACGASLLSGKILEPGSVLGSYRLLDLLGQGGMGVVYLAEHTRLGRRVAIKMLRSEFSDNTQAVRRFFSEARAVNKICHPHIVEITDFVERPGAENYYVMELLEGESLAEVLASTPIPPIARSVGIMAQVADALQAVHDADIVHRDLKPDNVYLIERAGQRDFVKLLDFGVAKLAPIDGSVSMSDTAAGMILGTPDYMSPEQASGKSVDHRTDIYAFGVMLYELVTGERPVHATSFGELVVKHLTAEPIPPRKVKGLTHDIPVALEDVILACMAKQPGDRPEAIRTVAARLFAIAEAEGWSLTAFSEKPIIQGGFEPLYKARARQLGRRTTIAASLAAAVLGAGVGLWISNDDPEVSAPTAPAAPATIEIDFESTPAGAEVFRAGEAEPLGRTPLTLPVERSAGTAVFELRLAGHASTTHTVKLDRESRITAVLPPVPEPPPAALAGPEPEPAPPAREPSRRKHRHTDPGSGSAATRRVERDQGPADRTGVLNPFDNP